MWRFLIRRRLKERTPDSRAVSPREIAESASVLFAIFARYGDSAIAFKVVNEFMGRYPGKRYTLITTRQATPYAAALVRQPVRIFSVNKRHNPLGMLRLVHRLKQEGLDLGFNPWSHGEESEFFVSFAKRFFFYRGFANFTREYNLYRRAREYLHLPEPSARPRIPDLDNVSNIVISPFSTDVRKSLDRSDLASLIDNVNRRFRPAAVTVAAFPHELEATREFDVKRFAFGKTPDSSRRFLELLKSADLFIGVDAGPLHLADALGLRAVGLFGPTAPQTILDRDSAVLPFRLAGLQGVFCDVGNCRDPVCLHALCAELDFDKNPTVDFGCKIRLETNVCRATAAASARADTTKC
jgi:ADP-heptose:LPS heptosyltransferase